MNKQINKQMDKQNYEFSNINIFSKNGIELSNKQKEQIIMYYVYKNDNNNNQQSICSIYKIPIIEQ